MDRSTVVEDVRSFIANELLDGDTELAEDTPLLEWGIINSLEIMRLREHLAETWNAEIPDDRIVPDGFASVGSISDLVLEFGSGKKG